MDFPELLYDAARNHTIRFEIFIAISGLLTIVYIKTNREKGKWFLLMTVVWTIINTSIAVLLNHHIHVPSKGLLPFVFTHIIGWMEMNIVLDIFYGIVAIWLIVRSRRLIHHRLILAGLGNAVLVQSIGLFILDVIFLINVIHLFRMYTLSSWF